MKTTVFATRTYYARPLRRYPYPNAAEPGYFANRLLDGLTVLATCIGVVTLFFYLATM